MPRRRRRSALRRDVGKHLGAEISRLGGDGAPAPSSAPSRWLRFAGSAGKLPLGGSGHGQEAVSCDDRVLRPPHCTSFVFNKINCVGVSFLFVVGFCPRRAPRSIKGRLTCSYPRLPRRTSGGGRASGALRSRIPAIPPAFSMTARCSATTSPIVRYRIRPAAGTVPHFCAARARPQPGRLHPGWRADPTRPHGPIPQAQLQGVRPLHGVSRLEQARARKQLSQFNCNADRPV